jgi:FkbM family methyltransferase
MERSFFQKIISGGLGTTRRLFKNPYKQYGISWSRLKKLKHQGYNQPGEIIIQDIKVKYQHPPELLHSVREIFIDDVYKITSEEQKPFIIDCGANIGLSVIYLKKQFPGAFIIAFEPDEQNFSLLKHNTGQLQDVQLENKAVWDADETLIFNMGGTQSSSHTVSGAAVQAKEVKAIRLKKLLTRPVFFLKMDIEGAEYKVIQDCREELNQVKYFFLEYHGNFQEQQQLLEILQILVDKSFKYYIKEATDVYPTPFSIKEKKIFDVQLNIFAFR